jgi:multiple sugar transport system substrate-binding protein
MSNRSTRRTRSITRLGAVLVAATAVVAGACSGGESADPAPTSVSPTTVQAADRAPVTLELWSSFTDQVSIDAFRPIVERCQADNPWLTINYVAKDDMTNAVTAAAEAGTLPDVIQADFAGGLAKLQASGAVLPLDEFASRDGFDWNQFTPGAQKLVTFDGAKWGLPLSLDTAALFYNGDVLAEAGLQPPTSFAEIEAAAEQLIQRGPDGSIQRIGWVPDVGDGSSVIPLGLLYGGKLFSEDGTQVLIGEGDGWAESFRMQKRFLDLLGPPEDAARFAASLGAYDSAQNFFITGQVPLYTELSYFTTWPSRFGQGKPAEWGVVPMPGPDGVADAEEFSLISSGNSFFLPADPAAGDPEASWLAAECMATAAQQIADFEVVQGNIPANIEALRIFEEIEATKVPEYQTFIELARSPNATVPGNSVVIEAAYDELTTLALRYRRGEVADDQLQSEIEALAARLQDELDLETGG